jgi:hypothetical protein
MHLNLDLRIKIRDICSFYPPTSRCSEDIVGLPVLGAIATEGYRKCACWLRQSVCNTAEQICTLQF